MGIGNLGITEILIIAVIILLFFGPERIPEISRSLGQAMREFRRGVNEIRREIEDVERTVSDREGGRGDRGERGEDAPARGRLEPGSWEDRPLQGPEHPSAPERRREPAGADRPGEASEEAGPPRTESDPEPGTGEGDVPSSEDEGGGAREA